MVQTNFVNAGKAATEDGVVINYDQPRVLPTKNRLKLAAVVAAGALLLVGVGGIFAASEFLDQGGSSGDGGNAITPGGDDNGQDDDNGHNNNDNNHAPDSFVDKMKNLGIEGEGWDDDNYKAAYDLQNNYNSMSTAKINETLDKMINPLDPKGTLAVVKSILFPFEGDSVIGEKNKLAKIDGMFDNYYEDDNYFSVGTHVTVGGLGGGSSLTAAMNHPELFPERTQWIAFQKNPDNIGKMTVDLNGVTVSTSNAQAYVTAILTVQCACFAKAIEDFGYYAAREIPAYQAWYAPVQDSDDGGVVMELS